ncbi:MAG: hypothetical protein ACTS41_01280 [Candidatus Hodgkinia cicadicola]
MVKRWNDVNHPPRTPPNEREELTINSADGCLTSEERRLTKLK